MRTTLSIVVAMLMGILGTQSVRGAALTADSGVDEILDALNARGQGLKDFSADVKLTTADPDLGTGSTRTGKVWFQNRQAGSRVHIVFDTVQTETRTRPEKIEYKLEDGILVDRDYRKKAEVTRQVSRPGEKVNLLKLGEGPFPLPIGQERQEVYRQFDVKKVAAKKEDPAGTVHVQLTPKEGTRFSRRFASIDIWVDFKDNMPVRIETLDKNGSVLRTTEMSNIRVNGGLGDAEFTLPGIDEKEWSIHNEAYTE